jgi:hypothetical protein
VRYPFPAGISSPLKPVELTELTYTIITQEISSRFFGKIEKSPLNWKDFNSMYEGN